MDDQDVMPATELDRPLEQAVGRDRAGRVVRVVEVEQAGALGDVTGDRRADIVR